MSKSYYRKVTRLPTRILLCVLLLALTAGPGCYSGSRPPGVGNPAPDFTIATPERTVALHDFRGKVVVLNFWATWCPPCVEEMPSLVQLQDKMKDRITVLAVSVDVDDDAYHRFVKQHNVNLLTVRDEKQRSNALYGTYKFPETYVIDRNGVVRRKFIGAVDWNEPDIAKYLSNL
jgi:cytochrome c biogenesis protein CcmG/thiol:disulfide interchange protein DsbE